MHVCRFFVAGAALCDVAFRDVVAGACDVANLNGLGSRYWFKKVTQVAKSK